MTKNLTASQCAKKLGLTFEQLQEIVKNFELVLESPTNIIPLHISKALFSVSEDLENRTPQLPPETEKNEVALTLADATTIAETYKVSTQTILILQEAIQKRHERIVLQEGYYSQKKDLAIAQTGKVLALLEYYRNESQELDRRQEQLDKGELSVAAIAQQLGLDIQEILDIQNFQDQQRLSNQAQREDAAEEQYLRGEQGKTSADSWTLMQLNLQPLGKQATH